MEWLRYDEGRLDEVVRRIVDVLGRGGVVAIPTDTCYGLAANAVDERAVAKVFRVKSRPLSKPVSIFVDSIERVRELFIVDELSEKALKLLPGRVTLIFRLREGVSLPRGVMTRDRKVGVRLSPHPLPTLVARVFGKPITATSANRSGAPPLYDARDVARELHGVDLIVNAGSLPRRPVSTVIDLTCTPPRVLRAGAVPPHQIARVLGLEVQL